MTKTTDEWVQIMDQPFQATSARCWSLCVEQLAKRHHYTDVTLPLPATTENAAV